MSAVRKFVTEKLGNEDIYRSGLNLKESYQESSARTPLVLIHTHGELPVTRGRRGEVGSASGHSVSKTGSRSCVSIWARDKLKF